MSTKPTERQQIEQMPQEFLDYMVKNYPLYTVIADAKWHAPKIWRAAMHAMNARVPAADTERPMSRAAILSQIVRDVSELDPADPARDDVVSVRLDDLRDIIRAALLGENK